MLIMSLKIDIHETYSLTTTSFTLYRYIYIYIYYYHIYTYLPSWGPPAIIMFINIILIEIRRNDRLSAAQ